MIKPIVVAAALLVATFFAAAALAEYARALEPAEAVSLHDGALDMVAYYTELDNGAYEVVATFSEKSGENPQRIRMALVDGDAVRFAVPGYQDSVYGFAREGDALRIDVTPTPAASAEAESLAPSKI